VRDPTPCAIPHRGEPPAQRAASVTRWCRSLRPASGGDSPVSTQRPALPTVEEQNDAEYFNWLSRYGRLTISFGSGQATQIRTAKIT
jgi:hypothetical protein